MKTTRNLTVKDRVFALPDIERISALFGNQQAIAKEIEARSRASYTVDFADDTRIEVDDAEAVNAELLARPARAVKLEFEFYDYDASKRMHLSLRHGNSSWDSSATVSGEDRQWVDAQFLALSERVETAKPQSSQVRRYRHVILHGSALGIGTLGQLAIDAVIGAVMVAANIEPVSEDSKIRLALISLGPILYLLLWLWRWMLGLAWGAFAVRSWLLELWPSVEFSFGPEHHLVEARRRRRLAAVGTLIVIPVLVAIVHDLIVYVF